MYNYIIIRTKYIYKSKFNKYNNILMTYYIYNNLKYFNIYCITLKFIYNGHKLMFYKLIRHSYTIFKYNLLWVGNNINILKISVEYFLRILDYNLGLIYNLFLRRVNLNLRLYRSIYKYGFSIFNFLRCLRGSSLDIFRVSKFIQIRALLFKLCFLFFITNFNIRSTIFINNKNAIMKQGISGMRVSWLITLHMYHNYFMKKISIQVSMLKYILGSLYYLLYKFRLGRDFVCFFILRFFLLFSCLWNSCNININIPKIGYISCYNRYIK